MSDNESYTLNVKTFFMLCVITVVSPSYDIKASELLTTAIPNLIYLKS